MHKLYLNTEKNLRNTEWQSYKCYCPTLFISFKLFLSSYFFLISDSLVDCLIDCFVDCFVPILLISFELLFSYFDVFFVDCFVDCFVDYFANAVSLENRTIIVLSSKGGGLLLCGFCP